MADMGEYANATREDVEDELLFIGIQLDTLDRESDDYGSALAEIEQKKRQLEAREAMLARPSAQLQGGLDGTSDQAGALWGGDWAFPSQANDYAPGGQGNGNGYGQNNGQSSGSGYSQGNKRPRPESSSHTGQQYPSKRHSPSTSSSETMSPATSNDFAVRPPGMSNFGEQARQSYTEQARQRHMTQEAEIRKRREAQLADEQLARSLSQPSRTSAGPSTYRPGVQTTISHDGSFRRPPPPAAPEPPAPAYGSVQFGTPSSMQPHSNRSYGQYTMPQANARIKPEPRPNGQQIAHRPHSSARIVDLTADDSDDSDDGIAEIAPSQFTPSQRRPVPPKQEQRTPRSPLPSIANMNLPPAGQGRYSYQQPTDPSASMPGAFPSQPNGSVYNGGQQVYGMPQVAQPAMGYQQRPPPPAGTSQYAGLMNRARAAIAGSVNDINSIINRSSAPPVFSGFDDDDDSDIEYGGTRQLVPGLYSGHEDLYNSRYNQILENDPEKTKEEINALLNNIRPDEDIPEDQLVSTPEAMNVTLHKYQELGLTWLKQSEEGSNKGGILGDDMGLGKTIQMISLMVTRKATDPRCKTTLIIAPVALLRQWRQEIQTRIKPGRHALSVHIHHGAGKKKSYRDLMVYDVVLTTFGSAAAEIKKMEKFLLRKKNDPAARPRPDEQCALIDPDALWYRVILDEAQNIKNKSTQSAKGARQIRAIYRWCMTGTPMMNTVDELYSLIKFLRIKPYDRWEKFKIDFTQPLKSVDDSFRDAAMKRLQALCSKIMIRRTKKTKWKGVPIITLPERTTEVDNPTFSEDEQDLYTALETKTQVQFSKYLKAGTVGRSYTAILVLLLRLRQACCHPHLIKDFSVSAAAGAALEDMIALAKELSPEVVVRIKDTEGNFECPICLDACTNPAIFIPCGHATCRDCFVTLADPANAGHMAEADGDGSASIKCPHCRGKVDPKRITDFNSFKQVHMPEMLTPEERVQLGEEAGSGDEDDDSSDSDTEDESDGDDDGSDLKDFIVDDDEPVEYDDGAKPGKLKSKSKQKQKVKAEAESETDDDDLDNMGGSSSKQHTLDFMATGERKKKHKKAKKSKRAKGKEKALTLAELKKLSTRSVAAKKKYLKKVRKDFVSSAKIDKAMDILNTIMDAADGEKILIFSQWTSLLDLMEIPIDEKGWGYRRYDGSMNARMRADAVDDLKDPRKNVRVMLVSLKAGNAGLNLNVASQVIMLDPFWNPYIEEQAIDRAHRIGQQHDVTVHRVLVENTVEDRIIELQEKKRALIEEALDESEGKKISRLGVQELAYLFGVTRNANETVQYQERRRQ